MSNTGESDGRAQRECDVRTRIRNRSALFAFLGKQWPIFPGPFAGDSPPQTARAVGTPSTTLRPCDFA